MSKETSDFMTECLGTRGNHVHAGVSQFVTPFFRNLPVCGQSLILALTESRCIDNSVTFTLSSSLAQLSTSVIKGEHKVEIRVFDGLSSLVQGLGSWGRAKERERAREKTGED